MKPNYQEISTFHHVPNDDPATYYVGPEIDGGLYMIITPHWNKALLESKDRVLAAEAYLEEEFDCEGVRIEWSDQLSTHLFTTLNF